ncbi:hypothetical protein F3J23_18150 [Chryseobacterium sp. Tr-659]|uniref:hypothetical protein n=1 Tax=Chryseobacterium sp. Tr-659 TaxID=2608340 RepID=UPI00141EBD45|nr:hypothetical protein [Chryseobacterium sp. Tr-659]NIF07347.1 hypothetical protein [Chryseobacterium sp. Tr-659]
MKRLIFIFLFICSGCMLAQSADQKKILEDSQTFMSMVQKKDYDGMMNLTYPAIFEKIDRDMMIRGFKMLLEENDYFKIDVLDLDKQRLKVSDIFNTDENIKYAFASYPMEMKMTFNSEDLDEKKKKVLMNVMEMQGVRAKFLDDNSVEANKLIIVIALNDKSTGNTWKYLNYYDGNRAYASVVPAEVMKKAKEYYANLLTKEKENAN